ERDRYLKFFFSSRRRHTIYWIVNLPQEQLEVYDRPNNSTENPDYDRDRIYRLGERVNVAISSQAIGSITVNDLFPTAINN
ncbi:MAG: Uma2 family endonuclease, partial [Okeania sp. SIO2H7]|nr:Uma2 family endonuclease [Okeania sp. SIO2H7]